jgi:hypothetical protein
VVPPSILVTASGRSALASKSRGTTSKAPEREGKELEGGSPVEIDREVLMQIIDGRVRVGIEDWWERYQLPMHNQNVRKLDELKTALERFKGAYWAFGLIGLGLIVLINHFWK